MATHPAWHGHPEPHLTLSNPLLVPQSPVTVQGFKNQIDGTGWLAVKVEHSIDDSGFVTRVEMETTVN